MVKHVLAIDASVAGIAGDMLFSSLIGLQEKPSIVLENIEKIISNVSNLDFHLSIVDKVYEGFTGKLLEITGGGQALTSNQLLDILGKCAQDLNLIEPYDKIARSTLDLIFEAERKVHSTTKIHLHELGTLDTIIDIIGCSFLLQQLQITGLLLSEVATGTGSSSSFHGILPVPAPATDYILQQGKIITCLGPQGEATTPTGAALLVAMTKHLPVVDSVAWERSSMGFGKREWKDRGNFVRTRLGLEAEESTKITIIETHIDDATGEILGNAMDELVNGGALDVSYYPIFMKKGRPAYCLRVLCNDDDTDTMAENIIQLTGSLGVRITKVRRHIGSRSIENVSAHLANQPIDFHVK
ncbi:MAG: nickel pincer cofactor biosynthesis protein LarC, partial [Candidatus Kariarchaeaceae archaeon]